MASFTSTEVIRFEEDDPDAFNVNKLFPPKKHDWNKFDPKAHPWIGTQYSDSKQAKPWFSHPAGQARRHPKIQPYGARAAGVNRYNARYRYPGEQNPYWPQQQYSNQRQPLAQPLQRPYPQMENYQTQQPDAYSGQLQPQPQSQPQPQQQNAYQEQQQNSYQAQQPASYQNAQPNNYQSQTTTDYQGTQPQQDQTPAGQQYSTGSQADQPVQDLQPTTTCPASCSRRCTTACPLECCVKHFEKVSEKEAGPSSYVSECPSECKSKCGIHCPQKCCGLNFCPFICRKTCLPSCPKKCCSILKEFLPPLALPPLKLSAAVCPTHCTDKCSTDCPQACCSRSEIPDKTTKCPSICLKVSILLYHPQWKNHCSIVFATALPGENVVVL